MSSSFTLAIETDNDAFGDVPGYEIARLLREAAEQVEGGDSHGVLIDVNGNTVGQWAL